MSFLKKVDKSIFYISAVICVIFVLWTIALPDSASKAFNACLSFLTGNFGWSYLISVSIFLVFCLVVAFSRFGKIKLGKDDDVPEYSTSSWFAMLFSAGMGIGLVFWSIAEPMYHLGGPPFGEPNSIEGARVAMRTTFYHWGLHPWAVFAVVGLALAYFQFRKGYPALISSAFVPVLGEEGVKGPIGKAIDILSVFATIFGVATSLGLGALQINSGLNSLYGVPNETFMTVIIIAVVTALFTISAVTGIQRGIRILSNVNITLAFLLMLFLLLAGPTVFLLNIFSDTIGNYLQNIVWLSFFTDPYGSVAEHTGYDWLGAWTVFYWAWWIAWGPFVGGFIARISKGRTVREFILGVLFAPTLLSFIWLTIFGGAAIHIDLFGAGGIAEAVGKDVTTALFVTLQNFPLGSLTALVATILISTFFITSADSATFVVGMLTSGGDLEPGADLKVFWGVIEGAVAAVLLITGGLKALQTASIAAAFPFMIVMLFMIYSIYKAFIQETEVPMLGDKSKIAPSQGEGEASSA